MNPPVRVLSVLPGLDPLGGGLQSGAFGLLLAGQRAGVRNVVAVPERAGNRHRTRALIEPLRSAGVEVETFAPAAGPTELVDRWNVSPAQASWIARRARDHDAVHVHGIWGVAFLTGLAAARATGTPCVVSAHESLTTHDIDDSRTTVRRRQKLALKPLYLRWTTVFVLASRLEIEESVPASAATRKVPFPLVDERAPLPPLRARGAQRTLRVGFLGRFDPKKNLELLIDAVAGLPEHVRLVIAGDGPPEVKARLRRRAEARGLAGRVEWPGFVLPGERARLLETLDVLALPSQFESFGMAAAEGMLHGVPVVVSDRTGMAELVRSRGGGAIVPPVGAALTDALAGFDRDRAALAELGAQGQAAVRAELGFEPVGAALRDAYAFALEAGAGR
jgi:glycosyltransferase involved in cell wall biosynthesis